MLPRIFASVDSGSLKAALIRGPGRPLNQWEASEVAPIISRARRVTGTGRRADLGGAGQPKTVVRRARTGAAV
jgi:hypothetical protein